MQAPGAEQPHELGLFVCSLLQTLLQQSGAPPAPVIVAPPVAPPAAPAASPRVHRHPPGPTFVCKVPGCTRELPAVSITKNRLLYNCHRHKLCSEHLLADSVLREGRDTRFCRKCHRLQDVSEFEAVVLSHTDRLQGSRKTCVVQINKHNQSRRQKRAERCRPKSAAPEDDEWGGAGCEE